MFVEISIDFFIMPFFIKLFVYIYKSEFHFQIEKENKQRQISIFKILICRVSWFPFIISANGSANAIQFQSVLQHNVSAAAGYSFHAATAQSGWDFSERVKFGMEVERR